MLLLALCLIGTAMAAPAIPEAPIIPPETHYLMAPLIPMEYSARLAPLRTLQVMIEPEPKEENYEIQEIKEANYESPEPKEEDYEPKEENYESEPKEETYESEPKEEKYEAAEPKEEFTEPEEPKEAPEDGPQKAPEDPILEEPKPTEPVVVKLEIPKPPSFISDWFSFLPSFSLPNINLPPFISNLFPSTSNPPKVMYPAYYTGYPGAVIVEAPKP